MRDYARWLRDSGLRDFETAFRRTLQQTNGLDSGGMAAAAPSAPVPFIFNGVEVRVDPMAREYAWRDLVSNEVLRVVREDADTIVELGSGWSANLFNLWLRGAPKAARYFGGEFAAGGREAAEVMAGFEPRMRYTAAPFDWSRPDFSFVPADAAHVTVYSCYSIEQIPQLGTDAVTTLLERTAAAQSVYGVFIEPVGWQWPEHADPVRLEPTRRYAEEKNYNLNLRQVVESLAADRRIEVLGVAVDVFGYELNPATVIHWRRP